MRIAIPPATLKVAINLVLLEDVSVVASSVEALFLEIGFSLSLFPFLLSIAYRRGREGRLVGLRFGVRRLLLLLGREVAA